MRKKLYMLCLCIALGAMLMGCGAKDKETEKTPDKEPQKTTEATQAPDTQKTEETAAPSETAASQEAAEGEEVFTIPMTEDYIYGDPDGLEFDKRYVYKGEKGCKLLTDMENMGYFADAIYEILYAKDDKGVAEFQYFVCPDEESATALNEFYASQGQQVTQEGNILYSYVEAEVLQANISLFSSLNGTADTTEAYLEAMTSQQGLLEY